ncbi:MAG: metal ABC transporter solute-binding protein, Zn/Mn family [Clostridiaceae bacterium]
MKKYFIVFIVIITIIFSGCGKTTNINDNDNVKIVVSFYALEGFCTYIGGDKVNISVIIPEGAEPHDYEPKISDMRKVNEADVYIYNGLGLESFAQDIINSVDNEELVIVNASDNIETIKVGGSYDPHIWLSIKNAKIECKNILEALVLVDVKNKDYYEKNYNDTILKMDNLYNEYYEKFKDINNKDFITGHAAFGYLCRDFNLNQQSVEDVFAEGEPTPSKLKNLVDFCREKNIKTIFVESLVSPDVSETLAREVGAKTKKIYTMGNKDNENDYLTNMEYDLNVIYNSLK